jgi:hypothetical protein
MSSPPPPYTTWFLANIPRQKLSPARPKQIYLDYYNRIREHQLRKALRNKPFLDIIYRTIRDINIATSDPDEKQNIEKQIQILLKVANEIRNSGVQADSEFLASLKNVLTYQPN